MANFTNKHFFLRFPSLFVFQQPKTPPTSTDRHRLLSAAAEVLSYSPPSSNPLTFICSFKKGGGGIKKKFNLKLFRRMGEKEASLRLAFNALFFSLFPRHF
jgi:hypothetical protein